MKSETGPTWQKKTFMSFLYRVSGLNNLSRRLHKKKDYKPTSWWKLPQRGSAAARFSKLLFLIKQTSIIKERKGKEDAPCYSRMSRGSLILRYPEGLPDIFCRSARPLPFISGQYAGGMLALDCLLIPGLSG